jgi:hypothetical protein
MSPERVTPGANGIYTIRGKNNRNLALTLDDPDYKDKYIVEELDESEMRDKLPKNHHERINWFACFSVYNQQNGNKHGFAKVKYSFPVQLAEGQKFWVAYNGTAYEVTDEIKQTGKVTLSEGDPATGSVP